MALLSKVVRSMRTIAPLELADHSWDNVGVLVEPPFPNPSANKVFLTIDLTPQVIDEALADPQVGTIVAYHPPIFRAMKQLTMSDPKQNMVMKAIARGVGIYSPHTACDNCVGGVNDWLASGLGPGAAQPIVPAENPPTDQQGAGTGRLFTLNEPTLLPSMVDRIKSLTGLKYVRVATAERHKHEPIRSVAICAGSGASVLNGVSTDLYFSGEMGHHDVLAALAQGTSVVLCEHTNTERGYLSAVLKPSLEKALANAHPTESFEVVVSQLDKDPLCVM